VTRVRELGSEVRPARALGQGNDFYRHRWVGASIEAAVTPGSRVLDVGCGSQPYRALVEECGGVYLGHDFAAYDGSHESGLQDPAWTYGPLDYVGDILDIPDEGFSTVICTEVLEHVPDPVAALKRLSFVTAPHGQLILTVPFLSLMHQAPYWFSSGLSPFWFEYWSPRVGCTVRQIAVNGDYADLVGQETKRMAASALRRLAQLRGRPFDRHGESAIAANRAPSAAQNRVASLARRVLPRELNESGAFGTYVVLERRPQDQVVMW
jgi:ubiquinone/menaquinone biosynthesis C-methylase UbiE